MRRAAIPLLVVLLSAAGPVHARSAAPAPPAEEGKALLELRGQMEAQRRELDDLKRRIDAQDGGGPVLQPPERPASRLGSGVFVSVEPQLISFLGVETRYAAQNTGAACPSGTCVSPVGDLATADAGRALSPRFEAGWILPHGAGVVAVGGFHAQASGHGRFSSPGNTIGEAPFDVFDEIANPAGNNQPLPDSADAALHVLVDQIDISYRYPLRAGPRLTLAPSLGLRRVTFDYDSQVAFADANPAFDFSVERSAHSQGTGPRLALGAGWAIGRGFSFDAEAGSGYLIGDSRARQVLCEGSGFATPGCGGQHTFALSESAGFPFVDGRFTLSYALPAKTPLEGLTVFAGWRFAQYFDLYRTADMAGGGELTDSGGNTGVETQQALFRGRSVGMSAFTFGASYLF